jgi:hypothetical protein
MDKTSLIPGVTRSNFHFKNLSSYAESIPIWLSIFLFLACIYLQLFISFI